MEKKYYEKPTVKEISYDISEPIMEDTGDLSEGFGEW